MKLFRKKTKRPPESAPQPAQPDAEQSFYTQRSGEAPLDEYFYGTVSRQTQRTSRHSAARRRETSNRASNWTLAFLLIRAALIVLLLVGGFIVLKLVLDRMAEPGEKDRQRWESNATLIEQPAAPAASSAEAPTPQDLVVSPELIERRLAQWEQTDRHLRSAEALNRRGIDEEAIQRLEQALRSTPDSREAQQMLVNIYMKKGLYAEAVPLCVRLLDQDGRQPDLQMNLLRALQESGQIDAGLVLADRMLLDQPKNELVLSIAAAGQIALNNKEAALALFGRMLENDDKNKVALEGCGKIYFDRGDYSTAVPYYLELSRLDPKPDYYQMLARCYAQQKQAGKAIIFLGQAASLFGEGAVSPWLPDPVLDPVRETAEFRSLADRLVGIETRKAIEALSKREAEKAVEAPGGLELPTQPELQPLRPGK
jgi:tetratricopeptide (TPR) repeat protein